MKFVVGIPVFNEARHISEVLTEVRRYATDIVVVDDGSTDGSHEILSELLDRGLICHLYRLQKNHGYGTALTHLVKFTIEREYDCLVTMDCDGQHQPSIIPDFLEAIEEWDIVSGTRYPNGSLGSGDSPPKDRLRVNQEITTKINDITGYNLTDGFCGFKAYRRQSLELIELNEPGYGMPLQLWIKAFRAGLTVTEIPVPRIYKDYSSSFGETLDNPSKRLDYYYRVINHALEETES